MDDVDVTALLTQRPSIAGTTVESDPAFRSFLNPLTLRFYNRQHEQEYITNFNTLHAYYDAIWCFFGLFSTIVGIISLVRYAVMATEYFVYCSLLARALPLLVFLHSGRIKYVQYRRETLACVRLLRVAVWFCGLWLLADSRNCNGLRAIYCEGIIILAVPPLVLQLPLWEHCLCHSASCALVGCAMVMRGGLCDTIASRHNDSAQGQCLESNAFFAHLAKLMTGLAAMLLGRDPDNIETGICCKPVTIFLLVCVSYMAPTFCFYLLEFRSRCAFLEDKGQLQGPPPQVWWTVVFTQVVMVLPTLAALLWLVLLTVFGTD